MTKLKFHPEQLFGILTMASTGVIAEGLNNVLYTDAGVQGWLGLITAVLCGNIFLMTTIDFMINKKD